MNLTLSARVQTIACVLGRALLGATLSVGLVACGLSGARTAANEAAAMGRLRSFISAENLAKDRNGGRYSSREDLVKMNAIDPEWAADSGINGYRFDVEIQGGGTAYVLYATPTKYGETGERSFFVSSKDSTIRGADKHGAKATETDPEI